MCRGRLHLCAFVFIHNTVMLQCFFSLDWVSIFFKNQILFVKVNIKEDYGRYKKKINVCAPYSLKLTGIQNITLIINGLKDRPLFFETMVKLKRWKYICKKTNQSNCCTFMILTLM